MRLIYIEWADAIADPRWLKKEDAERWAKSSAWIVRECGFLLTETKQYIVLVSQYKEGNYWSEERYSGFKKIPKTWIKKRVDLTKHIKKKEEKG